MIPDITKAAKELERRVSLSTQAQWRRHESILNYVVDANNIPIAMCDSPQTAAFVDYARNTALAYAKLARAAQELAQKVKRFERADTEFRRANDTAEQPRLSHAGTAYHLAKAQMFIALADYAQAAHDLIGEENTDGP